MHYKKSVLSNGITVVTEDHPHAIGLTAGIWVCTGTRDEDPAKMGISHLLEHLVFKGTKKRTAFQLAKVMESRGGELNAYTTREYTCYYATSLSKDIKLNLDVLLDIVTNATFPKHEFDKEKQVVIQEIAMSSDDYDEYVFDVFFEECYKSSAMGWPILGTEETISNISRKDVSDYYKGRYRGKDLMIAVAGRVNHSEVCEVIEKYLGKKPVKTMRKKPRTKPKYHTFKKLIEKDIEQTHILMGFEAPSLRASDRYESHIFNTLLGGGMTSKLYQSIRERKGLAYSVYSTLLNSTDSGLNLIYCAVDPDQAEEAVDIILRDLKKIRRQKVSKNELNYFRTQAKGYLELYSDDIENRMNIVGLNQLIFGHHHTMEDTLKGLDAVTTASMKTYIEKYVRPDKFSLLVLGSGDNSIWMENKLDF